MRSRRTLPSLKCRCAAAPFIALGVLLSASSATSRADEMIRQVQEELRRRYLYFGEIDARMSEEMASAIRRFQHRKGLSVNGTLDHELLASLGVREDSPGSAGTPWPEETVLRSDAAVQLAAEQDPEFLAKLEAAERVDEFEAAPPIAEEVPVASTPSGPPAAEKAAPSAAAPEVASLLARAKQTVEDYLAAAAGASIEAELAFYPPKVDYFDHRHVNFAFVEADVRKYRQRWPHREYTLLRIAARPARGGATGDVEVRFRIRFKVSNADRRVTGETDNVFRLRPDGDKMKLVFLRERRVRG